MREYLNSVLEEMRLDEEYVVVIEGSKYSFGVSLNEGMLSEHFAYTTTIIVNDDIDSMDFNYCKTLDDVKNWIREQIL